MSKGLLRVFNTIVQKHQFFSTQLSLYSSSHIHTWYWKHKCACIHTDTHTHTHTHVSPLFFNCRRIVPQCCAGFCYTPLWTSCNYTNTPSILSLLPSQASRSSHSTRLGSLCYKQLLTSYLFHTWHCTYTCVYTSYIYTSMLLSPLVTLSFLHCVHESMEVFLCHCKSQKTE